MPTSAEVRGWARLVAGIADQVAGTVQDMHRAVSDGAFRWVGPIGRPVKQVHDAVTDRAYGVVRGALRGSGALGAVAAGHLGTGGPSSPGAVKARAIAQGVVGEPLMALAPELDVELTLRKDGREVTPDAAGVRGAYPEAYDRVVVFVHGLVDSEAIWHTQDGSALPDEVVALGATPLLVRYGTGRAIGRNGADLAELLEAVATAWPVPLTRLVIVGHSMGGLVARAACATAHERDHTWPAALTDMVCLASPHLGSWLEKVANVSSWTLRRSSRSAPIGRLLDGRSRGIKDLRFGMLVEDGWDGLAVDDLLTGLLPDRPWGEGVTHHLVVGRLRPTPHHLLNAALGDGFVRSGSASGVGRRRSIGGSEQVRILPVAASHTRLVGHPEVAAALRRVLAHA